MFIFYQGILRDNTMEDKLPLLYCLKSLGTAQLKSTNKDLSQQMIGRV